MTERRGQPEVVASLPCEARLLDYDDLAIEVAILIHLLYEEDRARAPIANLIEAATAHSVSRAPARHVIDRVLWQLAAVRLIRIEGDSVLRGERFEVFVADLAEMERAQTFANGGERAVVNAERAWAAHKAREAAVGEGDRAP